MTKNQRARDDLRSLLLASDDGRIDRMLRANDREHAKRIALDWYPGARFWR